VEKSTFLWTLPILLACFPGAFTAPAQAAVSGTSPEIFDFEEGGGPFTPEEGTSLWEWGVPGDGTGEDPGPGSAGDGAKCWGAPLDGTYPENADAYIGFPEIEGNKMRTLQLDFMYWYDLESHPGNESDETGPGYPGDLCTLEVQGKSGGWTVLKEYRGPTTGDWVEESLDLTPYLQETVLVRLRLVDNGDGFTDNGFFFDAVELTWESRPEVDITIEKVHFPYVIAVDEETGFCVTVLNDGWSIPPETSIDVIVFGPLGNDVYNSSRPLEEYGEIREGFRFKPELEGTYILKVSLLVDGVLEEELNFESNAMRAHYHWICDSLSGWTREMEGDIGWSVHGTGDVGTPSGDDQFWFGSDDGGPGGGAGFTGTQRSTIATQELDLSELETCALYFCHRYDMGPDGDSGGFLEVFEGDSWSVVVPEGGYDGSLSADVPGGYSGYSAFTGSSDWAMERFDMDAFAGSIIGLRYTAVSGENGAGEGWYLDDIMITGTMGEPPDLEPPAPIDGLSVEVIRDGEVRASWYSSTAPDFDQYRIYLEDGKFLDSDDLVPNRTLNSRGQNSLVISGLTPTREYWIAVTAVDTNGNENTAVSPRNFTPVLEENRPPVAIITVEGGLSRRIGETITLTGSSSFDPDGDQLTYTWTLPDGSRRLGPTISWSASEKGEKTVILIVRDQWGDTGRDEETLRIASDDGDTRESWEPGDFVVVILPLLLLTLWVLLLFVVLGRRSRKKLERKLGASSYPGPYPGRLEGGPVKGPEKEETQILDLVPVTVKEGLFPGSPDKEKDKGGSKRAEGPEKKKPKPWYPQSTPIVKKETAREPVRRRVGKRAPSGKMVKAVLECPECGETFRKEVELDVVKSGGEVTIECPHCGMKGSITP